MTDSQENKVMMWAGVMIVVGFVGEIILHFMLA